MITWFERLFDHLGWANERTLEVVRRTRDGRARELLAHILATERVWMTRIRTGESSHLEIWPELDVDECAARMRQNLEDYGRLLDDLEPEEMSEKVAYRNSSGEEFRTPVGGILTHVALHGSHHRGQIARRVRRVGGEPENVDFIQFVRRHPVPGPAGARPGEEDGRR